MDSPSNTALGVGPAIDYTTSCAPQSLFAGEDHSGVRKAAHGIALQRQGQDLPLDSYAKGATRRALRSGGNSEGLELTGLHYEQLFPWVNPRRGAFRVIPGDYVTTDDGTGIVHIAGTFGADDLRVSRAAGVPPLHLTDHDGNIRPMVDLTGLLPPFRPRPRLCRHNGRYRPIFALAGPICQKRFRPRGTPDTETLDGGSLARPQGPGKAFRIENHTHSYPPLLAHRQPVALPLDSWFIRSTAVRVAHDGAQRHHQAGNPLRPVLADSESGLKIFRTGISPASATGALPPHLAHRRRIGRNLTSLRGDPLTTRSTAP